MKKLDDCIILFGGSSEERLVSVASAQNLSQQIPEAKLWYLTQEGKIHASNYDELQSHEKVFTQEFQPATPVTFHSLSDASFALKEKTVIIALHGTEGEDGQIQKFFEDRNISFTGTQSKSSEKAFNKVETKRMARMMGIPVADELAIKSFDETSKESARIFFSKYQKLVLKPSANGSSVGLFIVSNAHELESALNKLNPSSGAYLIEPFIMGREITVGVRETKDSRLVALPCSEVRVHQGRQFDYEGKYLGSGIEELTPAPISLEQSKLCQELALKTHKMIGCRGYSRTDMILTDQGPLLLEINTLPGLSKASFIPQQLKAENISLRDFFQEQINLK
jgi:D-alanine-D-alanine ligase